MRLSLPCIERPATNSVHVPHSCLLEARWRRTEQRNPHTEIQAGQDLLLELRQPTGKLFSAVTIYGELSGSLESNVIVLSLGDARTGVSSLLLGCRPPSSAGHNLR